KKYGLILLGGAEDPDSGRPAQPPNRLSADQLFERFERLLTALVEKSYRKTTTIDGISIFEPLPDRKVSALSSRRGEDRSGSDKLLFVGIDNQIQSLESPGPKDQQVAFVRENNLVDRQV